MCYSGGDWQDPAVDEAMLFLEGCAGNRNFFTFHLNIINGESACTHWSRYGEGYCTHCGLHIWHDFINDPNEKKKQDKEWWYFHEPYNKEEWQKAVKDYRAGVRDTSQVELFSSPITYVDGLNETGFF